MKEKNIDYSEIFSKMLHCLYVIIAILVLNSILLTVSLGSKSTTNNSTNNEQEELPFDVSKFTEMTTDQAMETIQAGGVQVFFIGHSSCGYCRLFVPVLQQAQEAFGYTTIYIDTDKLTNADSERWTALDEYVQQSFGRTPLTVITKDGQYLDGLLGYTDYDTFKELLERNGFQLQ